MTDQLTTIDGNFYFRDSQAAFNQALAESRLFIRQPFNDNGKPCVADYMYMGTKNSRDLFKHIDTRQYLP